MYINVRAGRKLRQCRAARIHQIKAANVVRLDLFSSRTQGQYLASDRHTLATESPACGRSSSYFAARRPFIAVAQLK